MKQALSSLVFVSILLLCSSAACKHDVDDIQPANPGVTTGAQTTNLSSGSWRVSYFITDGADMSHHRDGYTFVFQSGGILSVNTGITNVSGTWQMTTEGNKQELDIALSSAADPMLAEVAEDWTVQANTATELALIKSGGDPRELHFTKQ